MEFSVILDQVWPLVVTGIVAAAGIGWVAFKKFAKSSESKWDDRVVKIGEEVAKKIAGKPDEKTNPK